MALTTRVLTNAAEAGICYPDGSIIPASTTIFFYMVDADGEKVAAFDATTGEYVVSGPITVITNAAGVFTVNLWVTERADKVVYICMSIPSLATPDIISYMPAGGGSLTLSAFYALANVAVTTVPRTNYNRAIIIGTVDPTTEGVDGDIYIKF